MLCGAGIAQVYTIEPLYECKTIQLKSGGEIELYSIDSFSRGKFIIDLDKMLFTDPITIRSQPEIIDIKKVTRLEKTGFKLILKR
ncbi:MAG: hypothetical protein IPL12_10900 [Bacteroidetes bacterium]|nr:hypothetical protein [Bacteroidota bacterium]